MADALARMVRLAVLLGVLVWLVASGVARAQSVIPIADAGPDVTMACVASGGTGVVLNGMGSSMGDGFSYLWIAPPEVEFSDPTSLTPLAIFPVGTTEVTLVVTYTDPDTQEETQASDSLLVTITDTNPPLLYAFPDPAVLWPPNHKLVPVHVDVLAFDACDDDPEIELLWIDSNEDDDGQGDGNTSGDIADAVFGSDDRDFLLRAERSGGGSGRIYSVLYAATDASGNTTDVLAQVIVPHDKGKRSGMSDGEHDAKRHIKKAAKMAKKAAKLQMKSAKKAAKLAKKAYKAALRAAD